MREYIKIPVTQKMRDDLVKRDEAIDAGEAMDCKKCSLLHGEYGCLDKYDWLLDDPEHPASSEGSVFVPVKRLIIPLMENGKNTNMTKKKK